jgi:hypothetical protein
VFAELARPNGRGGLAKSYWLREVLLPCVLGMAAALAILGYGGLDPTNIGWNANGDAATHYLGWWFFRSSAWHFPLGASPDYGLELGSSIFYSDSIPLLAFLFKPFAAWLPTPFQYFGIWVALSLTLQAFFTWRLLGSCEATRSLWLRAAAVGLFLFSPPLLIRIGGHSALAGHWLILAALSFYFTPSRWVRRIAWPTLVLAASLVHSYLFVMVLALWFADLLRRLAQRDWQGLPLDVVLVPAAGALGLWQAGFFLVRVGSNRGYGSFGMNLLAPLNPDLYSSILPPVAPPLLGFHEGYNFAGLGYVLLVPALLLVIALRRRGLWQGAQRHWPLALVLLVLALFAVTHHVGLGMRGFELPLPDPVVRLASMLRSSGRMYWPVHYALLLFLVVVIARGLGSRVAAMLLMLATAVQVFDTSRGWWSHLHTHFAGTRSTLWPSPLRAPFWQVAGQEYRVLRRVPALNSAPDYAAFAYLAASHHMATNSAYLARVDGVALEAAEQQLSQALQSGNFEPDTLYVLDTAHATAAAETLNPAADLLARVDGYLVLAPGWRQREHSPSVTPAPLELRDIEPGLKLGREAFFGVDGNGVAYLGDGWSQPEAWGVWSEGRSAELTVPVDTRAQGQLRLALQLGAFVGSGSEQHVSCSLNGAQVAAWQFLAGEEPTWHEVLVPAAALEVARTSQHLTVRFQIESPASPRALGLNEDTRELGLALHRLRLFVGQ